MKTNFPTPGSHGLSNGSGNVGKSKQMADNGEITREEARSFRAGNGGKLNPAWEEWLMGWPIGWTSLDPLPIEAWDEWLNANGVEWWSIDPADVGYMGRVSVHCDNRRNRIEAIGNGQVPACVLAAEMNLENRNE